MENDGRAADRKGDEEGSPRKVAPAGTDRGPRESEKNQRSQSHN